MEILEVAIVVGVCAACCFAGGVVFAKTVLTDIQAIKEHITSEVGALRSEISLALSAVAKKF